jgi:hypothetical protein
LHTPHHILVQKVQMKEIRDDNAWEIFCTEISL